MNPFFNNMKPWWIAFMITWVVVAVSVRESGSSGNDAVQVALIAASVVALVVWGILRALRSPPE